MTNADMPAAPVIISTKVDTEQSTLTSVGTNGLTQREHKIQYGFKPPELSPWKCHMFCDDKGYGMTYQPQKGAEPNWFWRMTQHLILGHKWVKEQDDD